MSDRIYEYYIPEYYKDRDIITDKNWSGTITSLKGYLQAISEAVLDPVKDKIDEFATYENVEKIPNEYLPYLAYQLGYIWNYRISNDIQRNIVRNLLEIYKRKGTAFSFYFNILPFDKKCELEEPYKNIFKLDRSGVSFNSDSINVYHRQSKNNVRKIEIDDDGYIYSLTNDGIEKHYIDTNDNELIIEDTNIIDMCIYHDGIQKDYLYYITKDDNNKYQIYKAKLYVKHNETFTLEQISQKRKDGETSREILLQNDTPLFISVDSDNNIYVTRKTTILGINPTSSYYIEEIALDINEADKTTGIKPYQSDCAITNIIIDNDNNIILSHKGTQNSDSKSSHAFLKKYKREDIDNDFGYEFINSYEYCFGYDSEYSGEVTINDIDYNINYIYCILNNKSVYRLKDDEKQDYIVSDLYSRILNDNSYTYSSSDEYYLTNQKNIVLCASEYPDKTCLQLTIYDKDDEVFEDYRFDEETKTIKLNSELPDDEVLNLIVDEYNINTLYDYVNEKQRYIQFTDDEMNLLRDNGVIIYYNYNIYNGERLVPEIDYIIDYKKNEIYICREDLEYGTAVTIGYNQRTGKYDSVLDKIKYTNQFIKLRQYVVKRVKNIKIDNVLAEEFMTAPVVNSIEEVVNDGNLYIISNTNDYYYYDDDVLIHKNYGIYLRNLTTEEAEEYILIDNYSLSSSIDNIAKRVITVDDDDNTEYYITLERKESGSFEPVLLDDKYKFKIKKRFNYNNIVDKEIVNNLLETDGYYNLRYSITLTEQQRPYKLNDKFKSDLEVRINGTLTNDYTFDEDTNTIKFTSTLADNSVICIDVYNYKYDIYSIGIDNMGNISDYIAVGFDKCIRVYNKDCLEMHSYNTLFKTTNIINKLDTDRLFFVSNGNIVNYMYCSFEIGGSLTSKNYYSNGILVVKTNYPSDIIKEIVEYVRPVGVKLIIQNLTGLYYNFNSKTYKPLKYQLLVSNDENDTDGYPENAVDVYQNVLNTLNMKYERVLVEEGEYDFISAQLNDDNEIQYNSDIDEYRLEYTTAFANVEPECANDKGQLKNILEPLDEETRYYREQFLDSIQYYNSNNGPVSCLALVGQVFDIDSLSTAEDLYVYDAIFDDDIINEETLETTDNFTLFRDNVHFFNEVVES